MTVTDTTPAAPKKERWTFQWKELYSEVITSGLCTGCAGCVIACPHDVIGYRHEPGMYKPFHLIGLELSISVLSAALRGEPTGSTRAWRGDAVAVAKRDLKVGEMLDGEGGYAVWANAIPAARSLAVGGLPIGLAHNVRLKRPVAQDTAVCFDDVELVADLDVVALRREMEDAARPGLAPAAMPALMSVA